MNTYTLAQRDAVADIFRPIDGIPKNMTLKQAQELATTARGNGFDVVAFNTGKES